MHTRVALLLAPMILGLSVSGIAQSQALVSGHALTLSKFGGDATLPRDIGTVCLWDDGIVTFTGFSDTGWWFKVGKKTYVVAGVVEEETVQLNFRKKGDFLLASPVNGEDLVGADLIIVATLKTKRNDAACVARQTRTGLSLRDLAVPVSDAIVR